MLSLLFTLLACESDALDTAVDAVVERPWAAPDGPGPWSVGVTTMSFTDARGKEMVAEVWYPAESTGDEPLAVYEPTILSGSAYRDVPVAEGPWPLVAFSHGFGGIRYQSIFMTERLASHGYLVVSPDHVGNTLLDMDEERTPYVLVERPDDVRYSVDEVIARSEAGDVLLGGAVEGDRYAVMGHSFGALTSMIVGGGATDYQGVFDHCEEGGTGDFCAWFDDFDVDPSIADGHGLGDERAVVTVPMSPGLWYAFGLDGSGLAEVRTPMLLAGDTDGVLDYLDEALPCYENMASPKRLATFFQTGHYAFSDICAFASFFTDECDEAEAGYIEIATAHAVANTLVTAFLEVELRGDERAAPWLEDDYLSGIPEIAFTME